MQLRLNPFPAGKDFAVTFVDDTDLSTRDNTKPVYDYLTELGIRGTKTVWTNRQKRRSIYRTELEAPVGPDVFSGSTLEDSDYRDWICQLQTQGFEIALHGVAAGNSYRDEIISGLKRFRGILGDYPKVNVFHERNIDNLYCGQDKLDIPFFRWLERLVDRSAYQGHIEGSRYFWGDIAQARIKYMRLPFHSIQQVNTLRWNPSMPFHDPRRPYVRHWFASSDGSDYQRYCRLMSRRNIDRLERERGACVIYTHFAKGFARKVGSRYVLNPHFTSVQQDLAARSNGWFPTTSELLDRLQLTRDLRIQQDDRMFTICNDTANVLSDVAVVARPETMLTEQNGDQFGANERGAITLGSVAAKSCRSFACNHPLQPSGRNTRKHGSIRRERTTLELLNYLGLIWA